MTPSELEKRFAELAKRLERIERKLDIAEPSEPETSFPLKEPTTETRPVEAAGTPVRRFAAGHAPPEDELKFARLRPVESASAGRSTVAAPTAAAGPAPGADSSNAAAPPSDARAGLEFKLGTRWLAWAGALVVVLAVGFFVKLAIDSGWFRMPPEGKCLVAGLFGALLLAAGEWALRRIGRAAAVGLYAAGLGTLYVATYAAFSPHIFGFLPETVGFVLLASVVLLGFGVTLRARMLTIGVLSLLGGYLGPLLLNTDPTSPFPLASYITGLLAIGLALSAWLEKPFRPLRHVSLVCHGLLAAGWLMFVHRHDWTFVGLTFITLWWTMFLAEAVWNACRNQSAVGNGVVLLLATLGYVVGGGWTLDSRFSDEVALFVAVIAVVCAVLAFALGSGRAALRVRPAHALQKLAVTLWGIAGVLVVVAVMLHYDNFGRTISWLAIALVCIEVGRRLPSSGVQIYGLGVGVLSALRVVAYDFFNPQLDEALVSRSWLHVTWWTVLAFTLLVAMQWAALRVRLPKRILRGFVAKTLSWLSALGWAILTVTVFHGEGVTLAWLAAAATLLVFARFGRRQGYATQAVVLLAATTFKWMFVDVVALRADSAWNALAARVVLNKQTLMGLLVAAIWLLPVIARRWLAVRRRTGGRAGRNAALLTAVGVVLFALSFDVDRLIETLAANGVDLVWPLLQMKSFGVMALCCVSGFALWLWGATRDDRACAASGGGLMVVTTVMWLSLGTLAWRLTEGVVPAGVVLNAQFLCGAFLMAVLILTHWLGRRGADAERRGDREFRIVVGALATTIGLWLGSLEIDRCFATVASSVADPAMARQAGLSIYWGLFGIGLVVSGFAKRSRLARRAGLALLVVTLVKVLAYDMRQVASLYRVLSLLATGLLLLGTSVLYNKLAARLDAER